LAIFVQWLEQNVKKVLECRQLLIITFDDEEQIEQEGCTIKVIPVWKWLLGK